MAKKHIKFRAIMSSDKKTVSVEILEQSHTGLDFGRKEFNPSNSFPVGWEAWSQGFNHNGCRITSFKGSPRYDGRTPSGITIYLNSDDKEPGIIKMPFEHFEGFKECVEEYNRFFSKED